MNPNGTLCSCADANCPVNVYLSSLPSSSSIIGQHSALVAVYAAIKGERLENLNDATRSRYRDEICDFDWQNLTGERLRRLRSSLAKRHYRGNSSNKYISAARSMLRVCRNLGMGPTADTILNTHRLPRFKVEQHDQSILPKHNHIARLVSHCLEEDANSGSCDAAWIMLGYSVAPPKNQIPEILVDDFMGDKIILRRSNGSIYEVDLSKQTSEIITNWIRIRGPESGYLFPPIRKDDFVSLKRNDENANRSEWALEKRLDLRCEQAGISKINWGDFGRIRKEDVRRNTEKYLIGRELDLD